MVFDGRVPVKNQIMYAARSRLDLGYKKIFLKPPKLLSFGFFKGNVYGLLAG
jgi:hypothetical protein